MESSESGVEQDCCVLSHHLEAVFQLKGIIMAVVESGSRLPINTALAIRSLVPKAHVSRGSGAFLAYGHLIQFQPDGHVVNSCIRVTCLLCTTV